MSFRAIVDFIIEHHIPIRFAVTIIIGLLLLWALIKIKPGTTLTLPVKTKKYSRFQALLLDYQAGDKRSALDRLQLLLGYKITIEEMEYILSQANPYFLINNLKRPNRKLVFKNGQFERRYPIAGTIWALVFYLVTVFPALLVLMFFEQSVPLMLTSFMFNLGAFSVTLFSVYNSLAIILGIVSIINLRRTVSAWVISQRKYF